MTTSQPQYRAFPIDEKTTHSSSIKRTVKKYLYHWPLFLIGIIIAVGAAIFYIKTLKPVYEVKATLIINDEKKAPDQKSALQEIDLIRSNKIIENEIEILKSNSLIKQVVNDLDLTVSYSQKGKFSEKDLYKNSPVKFTLISPDGQGVSGEINIIIKDDKSFYIDESTGKRKEFYFKNNTFTSNLGSWKLEPTEKIKRFKGQKIKINVADADKVTIAYQRAIDASLPNKLTTAVVLSLDDSNPQRGRDILNGLIARYTSRGTTERDQEVKNTLDFLDERIGLLSGELKEAEAGIEGFKSSRGLTDISTDAKISLENMQINDGRLNEVNVQLSVIEGVERYVNSSQGAGKSPATVGISDPGLTSLIERLVDLQSQRERLLATTPETNPAFDALNKQISTVKAAIKENIGSIKASLINTRNKLQSFNAGFESSIKNIPTQERQYINIKRQQSIKENLYTYLLQKREELSVQYASRTSHERVVDKAYVGNIKSRKVPLTLGLAFLIGLILPAGFIFIRSALKEQITDIQDIKDSLDVPVISQLEYEQEEKDLIIDKAETSALSEQFRALRINLNHYLGNSKTSHVTLLTSSVSGEGKSFIAKNLGVALAYSGKRTVILELDMRRPKISELFNLSKDHMGMSDFLNQRASLQAIVQDPQFTPNLYVIGSGAHVNNPSELLEKPQLLELITSLRENFDHIIIDSPPVHLVPDAMVLSKLSDITLYIIRQGFTQKTELDFIKVLDEEKQLSNIHIIFNGIERIKYGYGYNYNNSYYTETKKKSPLRAIFTNFSGRF